MWRKFIWGGMELDIQSKKERSNPKRKYPTMSIVIHHLIHLNNYLEVYIIKYIYRAGKKKYG